MALPQTTTHQDRLLTLNINDAPASPGPVSLTPLFLDRENGVWVLYGRFAPGTVLPTHFHTGTVHFFTTKGRWNYAEHAADPQTPGSYLFEPAGSVHTFTVPEDATEDAEGFMVVNGANVNFLEGVYQDITDAGSLEDAFLGLSQATGIPPMFIRPGPASVAPLTAQAAE